MARSAVFVLASRFEGLPGALIQAMACGVPVVATDCRWGPSEVVRDGVDGLLVPVDDPRAMADKIDYLLDHPQAAAALAASGRGRVQRFRDESVLEGYAAVLTPPPGMGAS